MDRTSIHLSISCILQVNPYNTLINHENPQPASPACYPTACIASSKLPRKTPQTAQYDAAACSVAKEHWTDSFWRTNQTGAYSAILWELGEKGQCFVNTTKEDRCDQGIVPYYSVSASGVKDIEKAVKFADKHDLYLVVKNTGHDQ